MKVRLIKTIMVIFIIVISLTSNAQVKTKFFKEGIPSELITTKAANIPEILIKAPDEFPKLLSQKEDNPIDYSNRFAIPKNVNLDFLLNAGVVESKEFTIFVMTINAEKALNISLQFSAFVLPQNSVMSIYTPYEFTDSITSNENNENKSWATRVYQGSKLTISLKIPAKEKIRSSFKIDKIFFGFKKFGGEYFGSPGASASCNLNVLCPEGVGWENERNSVALISANGYYCTGSLIMNACNSTIPYFLTANHCLDAGNIPNWVFQFQYWSVTCTPNSGWREDIQFNGCTLRANNAASDFALLELNTIPQPASGIFYSGWNRNTTTPNGSVGIHHPAGDLMKFSRDFDACGISSWGGTNNHWVSVFEQGTVQPGSSGSPLYDMNHRIVGQLHGDQQNQGNYCSQRRGEYGKFDASWTGGGTNATRLSNWLDPSNTSATTTNTTNVANLSATPSTQTVTGYYTVNSGTTQTSIANDTYQQIYVPRSSTVTINFFITTNH